MNTSILRAVLVLALLLGTGVIANVFGVGGAGLNGRDIAAPAAPTLVDRKSTTAGRDPQAERRKMKHAVRRQLVERGYLVQGAGDQPEPLAVRAAVLAFEFDYKLALTARPSEMLLKALIFTHGKPATARKVVPETAEATAMIEEVQRALTHLGYGTNQLTSELDRATRQAIRKFERARGLEESGRISAPLIESFGPAFDRERATAASGQLAPTTAG